MHARSSSDALRQRKRERECLPLYTALIRHWNVGSIKSFLGSKRWDSHDDDLKTILLSRNVIRSACRLKDDGRKRRNPRFSSFSIESRKRTQRREEIEKDRKRRWWPRRSGGKTKGYTNRVPLEEGGLYTNPMAIPTATASSCIICSLKPDWHFLLLNNYHLP